MEYRNEYNILGIKGNGFSIEFAFNRESLSDIMYGETSSNKIPEGAWNLNSIDEFKPQIKSSDLVQYVFLNRLSRVYEVFPVRRN